MDLSEFDITHNDFDFAIRAVDMTSNHIADIDLFITLQAFYLIGGDAVRENGINYKKTIREVELGACEVGINLNATKAQYDSFHFKSSLCPKNLNFTLWGNL